MTAESTFHAKQMTEATRGDPWRGWRTAADLNTHFGLRNDMCEVRNAPLASVPGARRRSTPGCTVPATTRASCSMP